MAHERGSGDVVGRGSLVRTPVDDDWGQVYSLALDGPKIAAALDTVHPCTVRGNWLKLGWALRPGFCETMPPSRCACGCAAVDVSSAPGGGRPSRLDPVSCCYGSRRLTVLGRPPETALTVAGRPVHTVRQQALNGS